MFLHDIFTSFTTNTTIKIKITLFKYTRKEMSSAQSKCLRNLKRHSMRQKSCVNSKSRGVRGEWWETVTKGEAKCKPRLTWFPMYFYFAKCICFFLYLLHFSPGFSQLLSSSLARKTNSSAAVCVFSLWYISAHMLKVSLSCAQMVRAAPQFLCGNLTTADLSLATQKAFCWFALFCVSSF